MQRVLSTPTTRVTPAELSNDQSLAIMQDLACSVIPEYIYLISSTVEIEKRKGELGIVLKTGYRYLIIVIFNPKLQ